jgi:XRE family transcriptional regulator, regulator of sulfur utilization
VTAEPGGVLEAEGHQRGSVECLTVQAGEFEVETGDEKRRAGPGDTLRYRCDRTHIVRCLPGKPGRATMVCILKAAVME